MKKYIVLLLFVSQISCVKEFSKIRFTHYASNLNEQKKVTYVTKIPSGFKLKTYWAGGEAGKRNIYRYKYSSVFYVSDFGVDLNDDNIANDGYTTQKSEHLYAVNSDTLILSGKNKDGLYWKEVLSGKLIWGYKNVTQDKLPNFDKALIYIREK